MGLLQHSPQRITKPYTAFCETRWPGPVARSRWPVRWPVPVARSRWPGPGGPVPVARSRWPGPVACPGGPVPGPVPVARSRWPGPGGPVPVARSRWPSPGPALRARARGPVRKKTYSELRSRWSHTDAKPMPCYDNVEALGFCGCKVSGVGLL